LVTHVIFQALQEAWDEPRSILLDTELIVRESCGAQRVRGPAS